MTVVAESPDQSMIDFLRRKGSVTISELVETMGVTATAVRQRLGRLMGEGLIQRETERQVRGRPIHRYSLTEKGQRAGGDNFGDLATVLWDEIKAIKDPEIQRGLLQRVAARLAETYERDITGDTLEERMVALARVMRDRGVSFDVEMSQVEGSSGAPVLSVLSCPYPDIAARDRGVCTMEKLMISEALGEAVRLSECRLDGAACCTFTPSST